MNSKKVPETVTPAKAGVQNLLKSLDSSRTRSGIRRNDKKSQIPTFYETIKVDEFERSTKTVMPDLIRHPELIEITGFLPDSIRDLPE